MTNKWLQKYLERPSGELTKLTMPDRDVLRSTYVSNGSGHLRHFRGVEQEKTFDMPDSSTDKTDNTCFGSIVSHDEGQPEQRPAKQVRLTERQCLLLVQRYRNQDLLLWNRFWILMAELSQAGAEFGDVRASYELLEQVWDQRAVRE